MGKKILVVDDDATCLKIVTLVLKKGDYEPLQASNALDAVSIANADQPDLILMDVLMPGVNGLETVRLLKKNPLTKHIKIVAMSMLESSGIREKLLAAGCDGYISKPISNSKDLLAAIKSFLA